MNSRLIIAAGDISSSPVLAKRFRGKTAKELYRCAKCMVLTRSFAKPIKFAILQMPGDLTMGYVGTRVGDLSDRVFAYVLGVGFVKYVYKNVRPAKLKASAKLVYNIASLPMTLYFKGYGTFFDIMQISKLETIWFGQPVYIFDNNRIWMEGNFTVEDIFGQIGES